MHPHGTIILLSTLIMGRTNATIQYSAHSIMMVWRSQLTSILLNTLSMIFILN